MLPDVSDAQTSDCRLCADRRARPPGNVRRTHPGRREGQPQRLGQLTDGTATALDSNAPSACGGSWKGFLALHRAGKTYINVHTNDGVASTNTGPGDFPQGELRGQMLPRD